MRDKMIVFCCCFKYPHHERATSDRIGILRVNLSLKKKKKTIMISVLETNNGDAESMESNESRNILGYRHYLHLLLYI